jgi:hypothetical protein
VSPKVNSPRHNDVTLIRPIAPPILGARSDDRRDSVSG